MMKASCPDCQTVIEINERDYEPLSTVERHCPLCGGIVNFVIPELQPEVVVKEVVVSDPAEQNNAEKIDELKRELEKLKDIAKRQPKPHQTDAPVIIAPINGEDISINNSPSSAIRANGWNWGAFAFGWFWGLFNHVYWPVLIFACSFIPKVGGAITLIFSFIIGSKGNDWSWDSGKWESVDRFNKSQQRWGTAGVAFFVVALAIVIIAVIAGLS